MEGREIPVPVYAAGNTNAIRLALHALGSSLANLAVEYIDERNAGIYSLSYLKDKPNVDTTNDLDKVKWSYFFKADPNAHKVLGAYEGAYFRRTGVYRPQVDCIMRTLSQPFCHVCRKEIARVLFRIAGIPFDEDVYHKENPIVIEEIYLDKNKVPQGW
jgi:hypothetical protein